MSDELVRRLNDLQRQVENLIKPEVPLGMSLISETVLASNAAGVIFSSIPQGFRHLMIMAHARSSAVAELDALIMTFNSDGGANYDYSQLQNAAFSANRAQTHITAGIIEAASSRANCFSFVQVFISNYISTSAEKYTNGYGGAFGNLSADADLFFLQAYGHWRNTAAITTVGLFPITGPNFVSGSRFQLYGIM